jgi:monoterpene epsilon-lactone hydrolase
MSLRAELVRLGLRWLLQGNGVAALPIDRVRERIARFERWVPRPPADTETCQGQLGGVPAVRIATKTSRPERNILFLHGGGYVSGSPELYRHITWRIAAAAQARLTAIDYRLAPEHPFPAALDDALAAWLALLAEGADPRRAVVMGDSAGGGLALALGLRLRDEGVPSPAAIVALSPWTDLALTGESVKRSADPMQSADIAARFATLYLNGADPRNPYASPLYGDAAGLPPSLIQVGGDEMLLDDSVRMAERLRSAGCEVALEIWPRMPHVWHTFASVMPEARRAIARVGTFVHQRTSG